MLAISVLREQHVQYGGTGKYCASQLEGPGLKSVGQVPFFVDFACFLQVLTQAKDIRLTGDSKLPVPVCLYTSVL